MRVALIMKRFLQMVAIFPFSLTVLAQPFVDLATIRLQQFGGNENTTTEYSGILSLPLKIKNENYVIVAASYDKLSFHNNENPIPFTSLSAVSFRIGGIKKWNDSWTTTAIIIRTISSDFEEITSKDYQLGGVGLMTKTVTEKFKYKFGLYYNRHFFGNFLVPLLGFELKVSDRMNIYGVLPGAMNLEYKLSEKFYTGVTFNSTTNSYRLSEESSNDYIRESYILLKSFINYYPLKRLVVYGEIGHTAFRKFNIFEDGTKNRVGSLSGFKNNVFVNIGSSFRIRFDRDGE